MIARTRPTHGSWSIEWQRDMRKQSNDSKRAANATRDEDRGDSVSASGDSFFRKKNNDQGKRWNTLHGFYLICFIKTTIYIIFSRAQFRRWEKRSSQFRVRCGGGYQVGKSRSQDHERIMRRSRATETLFFWFSKSGTISGPSIWHGFREPEFLIHVVARVIGFPW